MNSKSYCSATIPNPNPNPNPNTITSPNSMQALHFIQALARISRAGPKPPTTHSSRTRKIRRAAYASMACVSGPRRTWSRTLLRRLRQRQQRPAAGRLLMVRRRVRVAARPVVPSRPDEPTRADALRRLLPGGSCMEYCNLLEEAADYVQCLRAQVQLMQSLVDAFSPY